MLIRFGWPWPNFVEHDLPNLSQELLVCTIKLVLSDHSKMDKTKIFMTNDSLMKVKSIAECSYWRILQYFWPALNDNWSWKTIFSLFESGRFRRVLLYCIFWTCLNNEHHWIRSVLSENVVLIRGTYMSAHILLNLLNELRKRDKMRSLVAFDHFFATRLIKMII